MPLPHILIIPPWFDIDFQHHFAKSYHRWAQDLADMSRAQVGLMYGEFKTGIRKTAQFEKKNLNYHYLGVRSWGLPKAGPGWLVWEKQYLEAFKEYVSRHGRPTVIHGFSLLGLIAAGMIHRKYNIPYVYTEELGSFITGTVADRLVRKATKYINQASLVCGISPGMVSALEKTFEIPVKLIPLYIDGKIFYPEKQNEGPPEYITIGFPAHTKGLDILIKAMAIVIRTLPEARLTIVDDVPEQSSLELLINSHKLDDRIRFTGAVPHDQIPGLLQRSHALISASRYESFGYTMAEALSCGRPVVATETAGSRYIVQQNMGIIVPQENPEALSAAMVKVYNNKNNFDPVQLHQQTQSRFGKEKIIREWMDHYRNLTTQISSA